MNTHETFTDEYPEQPLMSLRRLAKLQGMDEDKLRAAMEAYDKPSPKGTGMQLAYNGLWPSDEVEVFVRFGKIVIARLNGTQFIGTGDGHTNYWPCLRSALRQAGRRVSGAQRKHLDAWVSAPPSWARDEMAQKWPLNPTPIEGSNCQQAPGASAEAKVGICRTPLALSKPEHPKERNSGPFPEPMEDTMKRRAKTQLPTIEMNEKKPSGRPSTYTPEVGAAICERLAAGESLRTICSSPEMPHFDTVRKWAIDDVQGFYAQYTHARDIGLDMLADEILDGTAKPAPEGVDLRIWFDAQRWYLSKLAPKWYGDRLTQELTGPGGTSLNPNIPSKIEIVLVPTPKAPENLGSEETPRALPAPAVPALPAPTVPALEEQDPGGQPRPRRKHQQPPSTSGVWN